MVVVKAARSSLMQNSLNQDDRRTILQQLDRLLADPLFSNSKRYPAFLKHVVHKALDGQTDQLKERALGIEVFNRAADYDTNADPVVRVTAGEIRKHLAQYYYQPEHSQELRIELPPRTYVPVFRFVPTNSVQAEESPVHEESSAVQVIRIDSPTVPSRKGLTPTRRVILACVCVAVVFALGTGIWFLRDNSISRFWGPIVDTPGTIAICLPDLDQFHPLGTDPSLGEVLQHRNQANLIDVMTLNHISTYLHRRNRAYRIASAKELSLTDLMSGPIILVGAMDNEWTIKLSESLKFHFVQKQGIGAIVDQSSPDDIRWSIDFSKPARLLNKDFALIARYHDPTTDRPVLIAGGLAAQGTTAAGEALVNRRIMDQIFAQAPKGWKGENLEAVLETEVIDGKSGAPRLLAIYFW